LDLETRGQEIAHDHLVVPLILELAREGDDNAVVLPEMAEVGRLAVEREELARYAGTLGLRRERLARHALNGHCREELAIPFVGDAVARAKRARVGNQGHGIARRHPGLALEGGLHGL